MAVMEVPSEIPYRFSDYIVAYLDVLGQRRKLDGLRKMPATEQEMREFECSVRETLHTIHMLRQRLRCGLELYGAVSCASFDNDPNVTEDERLQKRNLVESTYQRSVFSDSIAVTARYCDDKGQPLIQHVFGLLHNLSAAMITLVSERTPIRGAIEVGKALELTEGPEAGSAYGPILDDVYKLESCTARYPRIVVGPELRSCICTLARQMEERHDYYPIIQLCDNMISTDRDGISILDYLGPTFFGMTRHVPQMRDFVRQGCDFVVSEYKRFQADNDREMAWRYQMLMEYYSDRVGIWE